MRKNDGICYTDIGDRAFICPSCKHLRYIDMYSHIRIPFDCKDVRPCVKLSMTCPFCGQDFSVCSDEGIEPAIAPMIRDLELKTYKVLEAYQDRSGETMVKFKEILPQEAKDLLSPAWIVEFYGGYKNNDHTAIKYCSGNLDERLNSLAEWVDAIPPRYTICPPNKFIFNK